MGFSYFGMVEEKYSCKVSLKKPIIIRLDGKGVTKNKKINMYDEKDGGFANALKVTAREISRMCNALVLASADEINIIFIDTDEFYKKFNSCKCQKSSSLITQEVCLIFNNYYKGNTIYFDARTFNVEEHKILSYLKFRVNTATNVNLYYSAKRLIPYTERKGMKSLDLLNLMKDRFPHSLRTDEYSNMGIAYYKGGEVDINRLLNYVEFNDNVIKECFKYDLVKTKDLCINVNISDNEYIDDI